MRSFLVWSIIVGAFMGIAWLFAGRQLPLFLDRFYTLPVASLPVSPLEYDGGGFRIGELPMTFVGTDNLRTDLTLHSDSMNRVVLLSGGQSFTLGPRLSPPDPAGRPEIKFTNEPGDEFSFRVDRSVLSRPTPFEINFLGGSTPSWRRHWYYRLEWKKRSGAKLDMLWRYEKQYYSGKGWTEPLMMYDSFTGLMRVKISPEAIPQETAVVQYISRTKGWRRSEYRIESRGVSADGNSDVLAVICLEDERGLRPGAGKSVELYVGRASHQVTKELGGQ